MLKYIGKRLLLFIPTIFIISVVIFFIIQLPPGDYATSYAAAMAAEGEIMTPEQIQELRMQFGLDKPWYIQYFNWMADIITKGDFGYSFEYGRAVWDVIAQYLPLTLGISFVILVFQYAVSLPIGIYCANHQYSVGDYIWSFIGFIGTAQLPAGHPGHVLHLCENRHHVPGAFQHGDAPERYAARVHPGVPGPVPDPHPGHRDLRHLQHHPYCPRTDAG